jgi:arylformamidase
MAVWLLAGVWASFFFVQVSLSQGNEIQMGETQPTEIAAPPTSETPAWILCQNASAQPRIMKSTHVYVKNSSDPESQSLDLYVPSQTTPDANLPIMLYVHGGGLVKGDKSNLKGHETAFPNAGCIVACMNYRKSGPTAAGTDKAMYPDHVEDVAAAVAWLYYNAKKIGGDSNRIYLMGHSMGAGLVALVATDEQFLAKYNISLGSLKGVICNDGGHFDLMERAKRPQSRRVIENAYGTDQNVWRMASPSSHVRAGKKIPPFFLTYTTAPKEAMADAFARLLSQADVPVTTFSSLGRNHEEVNFAVSRSGDPLNAAVFRFLAAHGMSGKQTRIDAPPTEVLRPGPSTMERKRLLAAFRNLRNAIIGRI